MYIYIYSYMYLRNIQISRNKNTPARSLWQIQQTSGCRTKFNKPAGVEPVNWKQAGVDKTDLIVVQIKNPLEFRLNGTNQPKGWYRE